MSCKALNCRFWQVYGLYGNIVDAAIGDEKNLGFWSKNRHECVL